MLNRQLRTASAALALAALCGPWYGALPAALAAQPREELALNTTSPAPGNPVAETSTAPQVATAVPVLPTIQSFGQTYLNNLHVGSLNSLERLTNSTPPHLDVTFFGGGFVSQDYYLTDEGIQLEQSLTEGLGLVGRVTGYQLWIEKNSTSPLAPNDQAANRLNFARFEAGFDISPVRGFNFTLLGGHDVGDSDAWVIEADISAWFFLSSDHPVNLFIAPVHDFQNDVTSSEIDIRVVVTQTPEWIFLAGAGGQIYGGGFISGLAGEGGPILGVYNRLWQAGADLQFGYGSPGAYGYLNLYKNFSIPGI